MNTKPLRGTRDLSGSEKVKLDWVRSTILGRFRLYGYARVEPPILEGTGPFLERSGEEIRRHMYSFQDPSGRDVCLRPELTIPTCRLFLDRLQSDPDSYRVCYDGIVLRYDPVSFGRLREFRQVGVEHFGHSDAIASDAEAVELAVDAVRACGLENLEVVMNDTEIVSAMLDDLQIESSLRERIWQRLHSQDAIERILREANDSSGIEESPDSQLAGLLDQVDPTVVRQFIVDVLALTHGNVATTRSVEEIADRLVYKMERRDSPPLSASAVEGLQEVLSVDDRVDAALDALKDISRRRGFHSVSPLIDRFSRRLDLLQAAGLSTEAMTIRLGLRRSLQYYAGFIFEIHEPELGSASEICGGGRYDRLLKAMGASDQIPAVGFAIGAERVQLALAGRSPSAGSSDSCPVDVIVAPVGDVGLRECFQASNVFRNAGWSVETELTGRRPRSVIAKANRMNVRYVAFVGQDEIAGGGVNVKDLQCREEQLVALEKLGAFASSRLKGTTK